MSIVYAPFVQLRGRIPGNPEWQFETGFLEKGSKVDHRPIQVGLPHDRRFLTHLINVQAKDWYNTAERYHLYLPFQNKKIDVAIWCESGGIIICSMTYNVYLQNNEEMGEYIMHELTGLSNFPVWRTFIDKAPKDSKLIFSSWTNYRIEAGDITVKDAGDIDVYDGPRGEKIGG